ncbi:hypothetical protein Ato02nite_013610 [Paractinoplanes toevensis]|jgi:hypothetical protein|uniref:Uncharacterized protein n=2 Tax=Paractinoplanes toevensis TaxID=571911 RepID=A0A919W3Z5_9ACTN|nr:hypothetical protein Ato02nite_013610 [Actinoplanes toevensis]
MPAKALTSVQRATLLALMVKAGPTPLAVLSNEVKISLKPDKRNELVDLKLITVAGKPMTLELTEQGWAESIKEFRAEVPPRAGSLGGVLYLLLGFLRDYLERHELSAGEFFASAAPKATIPDGTIEDQIRKAYADLAAEPGAYLMLEDLRAALPRADRPSVDAALLRLDRTSAAHLIPESNQKVLTPGQRAAAIRIGNQDMHLVAISPG